MENKTFFETLLGNQFVEKNFKDSFYKIIETKILPSHYKLISSGDKPKYLWFINQGFAMSYILREDKKVPVLFWNENDIISPINGIFNQLPSKMTIELLEKSNLSVISHDDFNDFINSHPIAKQYFQKKSEEINHILEKRITDLLLPNTEDRYTELLSKFPIITLKAPVEMIAAYLGISRKTFNRIRAKNLYKTRNS